MKEPAFFKYIASVLIFGTNGIFASMMALSAAQIVLLRCAFAAVFLCVLFFALRRRFTFYKNKKHFLYIILSGVSMGAGWIFLYEGYDRMGVSISTLVCYCGPIFVMILAPIIFKEKNSAKIYFCFAAVVAGMFLINGQILYSGGDVFAVICCIMPAILYCTMVIFNKKAESITGMENTLLQMCFALAVVFVCTVFTGEISFTLRPQDILPAVILGLFNTGFGCFLYFSSLGKLPARKVSVFGYLEPLSAVLFSSVFLGEVLLPLQIAGAVLIIGGAVISEIKINKKALK